MEVICHHFMSYHFDMTCFQSSVSINYCVCCVYYLITTVYFVYRMVCLFNYHSHRSFCRQSITPATFIYVWIGGYLYLDLSWADFLYCICFFTRISPCWCTCKIALLCVFDGKYQRHNIVQFPSTAPVTFSWVCNRDPYLWLFFELLLSWYFSSIGILPQICLPFCWACTSIPFHYMPSMLIRSLKPFVGTFQCG